MNRNSYDYSILVVLELQQWLYGTLIVTVTITYFNFISLVFIQVTKLGNYILIVKTVDFLPFSDPTY